MQILDKLFGPQLTNLQRSLGRTTERHGLITANLANLNTPGYKRKDVDFGIVLSEEQERVSRLPKPRYGRMGSASEAGTSLRLDGNNVDLEREAQALAETELRYQALTEMASRYFAGLKTVIKEGR